MCLSQVSQEHYYMLLQLVQAQQGMLERVQGSQSQSAPANLQLAAAPDSENLAPTTVPKPAGTQQDPGDSLADHAGAIILLYSCK